MSVLVLHRFPLDPFPYDRWLADHDGGVVMIAARDCVERGGEQVPEGHGGYRHLEIVDSFDDDEDITRRALALARRHGVTRVIAHHEAELLRAALLRERLGLPGPRREDVLPFRDKVLMKRLAAEAEHRGGRAHRARHRGRRPRLRPSPRPAPGLQGP
ncbi:hypothetical protein R2F25_18820 [Streptomyces sp. UP1A-1]|nr:hypothetical protein [Streptomyces sp. UP1A-1]